MLSTVLQLQPEFEVLVVDDNSPDGTADLAEELESNRIHIPVSYTHLTLPTTSRV